MDAKEFRDEYQHADKVLDEKIKHVDTKIKHLDYEIQHLKKKMRIVDEIENKIFYVKMSAICFLFCGSLFTLIFVLARVFISLYRLNGGT